MIWTKSKIEQLKTNRTKGASYNQLALGFGVTRNVIAGRLRRLGLFIGRPAPKPKAPKPPKVAKSKPILVIAEPVYADHEIPQSQRRSVMELNRHTCKWPIGDPRSGGFFFCGGKPLDGQPYCKQHSKAAFQVFDPNRKRAMFTLRHSK